MSYRNPVRSVGVSGTVAVTGTVATTTATAPAAPAMRKITKAAQPNGNKVLSLLTPSDCQSGDVLVVAMAVTDRSGGFLTVTPDQSGWTTRIDDYFGFSKALVYTRPAASTDAAGAATYTFTVSNAQAGARAAMTAGGGLSTVALASSTRSDANNVGANTVLATGTCKSPGFVLSMPLSGTAGGDTAKTPVWLAAGSGGPPATQPSWTGDTSVGQNVDGFFNSAGIFSAPITWSADATYQWRQNSDSGNWTFAKLVLLP